MYSVSVALFFLIILQNGRVVAGNIENRVESNNRIFQCKLDLPTSRLRYDDETRSMLEKIFEKHHIETNRDLESKFGKPPSSIQSSGLLYTVTGYFRSTKESVVYLAERNEKKYSIGAYLSEADFRKNIRGLEQVRRNGILTAGPLSVDARNRTEVYPYFRGVSVSEILSASLALGSNRIHFLSSGDIKAAILDYGKENISKLQDKIFLDIDSGKFVLMDFY
jgi:hypothetical protein